MLYWKETLSGFSGLVVGLVVGTLLFAGGCCSTEVARQAQLSEVRTTRFIELIDAAQTTREQEQDYIRACKGMFTAIREATQTEPAAQ